MQAGLFLICLGYSLAVPADDPCWSFGLHSPGELCWITDRSLGGKVLLGRVEFIKNSGTPVCIYESLTKGESIKKNEFAALLGDFKGLKRIMPDTDPQIVPQFINRFQYCHPNIEKAKKNPLMDLLMLSGAQDEICFKQINDEAGSGVEFGFWNNKTSACINFDVIYREETAISKKISLYRKICFHVLMEQSGWSKYGPKGEKSHYGTTGGNWFQGMNECKKQQSSRREEMPYCSWDDNGDFYFGKSVDYNDKGDGMNAVIMYRCVREFIGK